MRIFPKISKIRAQHSIEYIVLLTLIMAGIIIIGPYVIRSWNANLKGWEDSVIDSLEDPLLEVPPEEAPIEGCHAKPWGPVGCNLGVDLCNGIHFSCGYRKKLFTQEYTPNNCECGLDPVPVTAECRMDNSFNCCEPWDPGRDPGSPRLPTAADCGPPNCPEGEYYRTHICDDGEFEDDCEPDPVCGFSCQEPPVRITADDGVEGYGDVCPSAETGLTNNTTPYTYVADNGCTGAKCEIQCDPACPPNPEGTYCVCPSDVECRNEGFGIRTHEGLEYGGWTWYVNLDFRDGGPHETDRRAGFGYSWLMWDWLGKEGPTWAYTIPQLLLDPTTGTFAPTPILPVDPFDFPKYTRGLRTCHLGYTETLVSITDGVPNGPSVFGWKMSNSKCYQQTIGFLTFNRHRGFLNLGGCNFLNDVVANGYRYFFRMANNDSYHPDSGGMWHSHYEICREPNVAGRKWVIDGWGCERYGPSNKLPLCVGGGGSPPMPGFEGSSPTRSCSSPGAQCSYQITVDYPTGKLEDYKAGCTSDKASSDYGKVYLYYKCPK